MKQNKRKLEVPVARSKYSIEKDIPVEPAPPRYKYPFTEMKVGDSFLVPIDDASPASVQQCKAQVQHRHPGFKFITRLMKKENGTRVWCIETPERL